MFFNSDGGREALYAYIVAAVFKVFGSSVLTLRGTAAAVGVAGVIAIYVAVRRFGREPALVAMAWTAGSLWMIAVSRDGFRNILTVLVGAAALAVLLRWGDRPSRWTAVAAGVVTALGFWTYQPLKLLPLLVILWLLWMHARQPERFQALRSTWRWATTAFVVVVAPMVYTAITDFSGYFGRAAFVSVFNSGSMSQDSYPVHILKTLGMFFVTGDPNPRHDVAALPLLGPIAGRAVSPGHLALLATARRPRVCADPARAPGVPDPSAHRQRGWRASLPEVARPRALRRRLHRPRMRRGRSPSRGGWRNASVDRRGR